MLHDYTITFALTDEQEARLVALARRFNQVIGGSVTPQGMLSSLLLTGSAHLIDERLSGLTAALDTAEARTGGDGHV